MAPLSPNVTDFVSLTLWKILIQCILALDTLYLKVLVWKYCVFLQQNTLDMDNNVPHNTVLPMAKIPHKFMPAIKLNFLSSSFIYQRHNLSN